MRGTLAGVQFKSSRRIVITVVVVITTVTTRIFIIININYIAVFSEQFIFPRTAMALLNKRRCILSAFVYCLSFACNFVLNVN